jgi:hypothetical protein
MRWLRCVFLIVLLTPILLSSRQSNFYITPDGAGAETGADWANACDGFTGSCVGTAFTRGSTVWLCSGTYAEDVTLNEPASGTTRNTLKKAIPLDHGTETGWDPNCGIGAATFTGSGSIVEAFVITADTGYWTIDGQIGSAFLESGFGIVIQPSKNTGTTLVKGITISENPGIILRNMEFHGPGENRLADGTVWTFPGGATCSSPTPETCGFNSDAIYAVNTTVQEEVGVEMYNLYLHEWSREPITLSGIDNVIFEMGRITRNHTANGPLGQHGQAVAYTVPPADNIIIRNSDFFNTTGSAAIAMLGANGLTYSNFYICGNTFSVDDNVLPEGYTYSPAGVWVRTGTVGQAIKVFNNTFYNISRPNTWVQGTDGGDNETKNNIYVNSIWPVGQIATVSEYNAYFGNTGAAVPSGETGQQNLSGVPFVDAAGGNFALTAPTNAGVAVPAPCATDRNGVTLSATPGRGAIQFATSGPVRLRRTPAMAGLAAWFWTRVA